MKAEKHTISCIVNDHTGVLVNIAASFANKGINITTLDSGEPDEGKSRVTVVVRCSESVLLDVVQHLKELPDVVMVEDLDAGDLIERQLMLVRVTAEGENIARIMQYVELFRATIAGMGEKTLTIEMAGPETKVDALALLLKPFGILEIARTGRVAIESDEHAVTH